MIIEKYKCPCGHWFEAELGKYGCPDCCGENVAELKEVTQCDDCGGDIEFPDGMVIKGLSTRVGVYYEGTGICWKCAGIRYEKAIAAHESKNL